MLYRPKCDLIRIYLFNNSVQKNFVISVDDKKGLDDHSSDGPDDLVQDIDMTPPGKAALPSHVPCLISEQAPVRETEGAPPLLSAGTSSRGRQRTMSRTMAESVLQQIFYGNRNMHYMASQSLATSEQSWEEAHHDWHIGLQERMRHPIAFHAEMMGDIMHLHQALKQPDAPEFVKAVVKEMNDHIEAKHWQVVKRSEVPPDQDVIPAVWAMRRKRDITTNEITKYKARLNINGGKQVYGLNYYETYAPVVTWFAIRLVIILAVLFNLAMRQIDFTLAYTQAPVETDLYMELPQGIESCHGDRKNYVLKLLANFYGQKQAGRVWNHYLVERLEKLGFTSSLIDECVFYRNDVIFILYVDDGIFLGKDNQQLSDIIMEL